MESSETIQDFDLEEEGQVESYDLSPLQEGMLIHTLRDTGVGMYLSQAVFTLHDVEVEPYCRAWKMLVERHSILRTSFHWQDTEQPQQVVHARVPFEVEIEDWRDVGSLIDQEAKLKQFLRGERERGFDLNKAPLFRLFLFRKSDTDWFFIFSHHHLLLDGWSNPLLMGELRRLYEAERRGQRLQLPPQRPFRDYIKWLKEQDVAQAEAFWKEYLAGVSSPTPLPTDLGARRRNDTKLNYGVSDVTLEAALVQKLQRVSRYYRVTANTVLLAAFAILFSRYNGMKDVVIGLLFSGRPATLDGVESMIGMFLNTLPCRITVEEDQLLSHWLRDIQEQQFRLTEFEYSPLRMVQQWSEFPSGTELFESVIDNNNTPGTGSAGSGGMAQKHGSLAVRQNIPLHLDIEVAGDEQIITCTHDLRRFETTSIVRLLQQFQTLVDNIANQGDQLLSDLSMMSAAEYAQVVRDWNDTQVLPPPEDGLHQVFENQAAANPDSVAVRFRGEEVSYREINERANRLAHYLAQRGLGADSIIGICVPRSPDMVVSLLAVLKSGGVYVPLDPAYPKSRLEYIVEDSGAEFVLTTDDAWKTVGMETDHLCLDGDLEQWQGFGVDNPSVARQPMDLAYILYTSGSTGKPKGVAIPHKVPLTRLYSELDPFEPTEAICVKTSLNFVDSIWEMFSCWHHGLTATLVPEEFLKDPEKMIETLAEAGATRIVLVPSLLRLLLDSGVDLAEKLPALRHWICSGEPLPSDLCLRFSKSLPGAVLTNLYGTTETWDVTRADSRQRRPGEMLPIGAPIPNSKVYVLDDRMRPVPIGVPGELYIGGDMLPYGYWNQAAATAEKFIPNPFSGNGDRLYSTGDLVKWGVDGNLEHLGRRDQQVKLRGYRIEILEIENTLRLSRDVRQAAVLVTPDEKLVALVVLEAGTELDRDKIWDFLSNHLPSFMIPSEYKVLDNIPLTPNGKIDRLAIVELEKSVESIGGSNEDDEEVGFNTETEEAIAKVWSNVLSTEVTRRSSHFFRLGGHSLMAARVAMQLSKSLDFSVPLHVLFNQPVLSALAAWIDEAIENGGDLQDGAPELSKADRGKEAPLSYSQQSMWFLDQLNPGSVSYTVPNTINFMGDFDVDAMRKAFLAIVERHEILRTVFRSADGHPHQLILEDMDFDIPLIDLSNLPEAQRESTARIRIKEQAREPWDLENGPLIRVRIYRRAKDHHSLMLTMHHIITDGRSMGVLTKELSILYRVFLVGAPSPLPDLPLQYADYAIWQNDWMKGDALKQELGYWEDKLGDAAQLELPTDHPRPLVHRYKGSRFNFTVPGDLTHHLQDLARSEGATMFMVLLAGFQLLLSRYSGQNDISVGTPSANRSKIELESLVGFFVNTLVMRTVIEGDPGFRGMLETVRDSCVEAYAHQEVPFEKIVDAVNPVRDLATQPLFQVMFVHESAAANKLNMPGVDWKHSSTEMETSNFDVLFLAHESDNDISCSFQYNSDLFDHTTIERMGNHLMLLLEAVAAEPDRALSQVTMLSDDERNLVLDVWNDTDEDIPTDRCVHELIAEHAVQDPDHPAMDFRGEMLSRHEVDVRANRLANYLCSRGVVPETIVGICLERSMEQAIALQAVLKAGGAFIVLDPDYPQDRLQFMMEDSGMNLVVTQEDLRETIPLGDECILLLSDAAEEIEQQPETCPDSGVRPENMAYMIYTSGTTGTPKGVMVEHRNLVNLVSAHNPRMDISADSRVMQMMSLSFDAGLGEYFRTLTGGGCLYMARKEDLLPSDELIEKLRELEITTIAIPPAVLSAMPQGAEDALTSIKVLTTAGEAFSTDLATRWGRNRHINTGIGSTECTIGNSIAIDWNLERKPPLGSPLANNKVYVLDEWLQPVPIGTPGELFVGGRQVSRGYRNNPAKTAEKFLPDPFSDVPGARMYRTGDMVRWLASGNLDFLSRADFQVKIRGYRIELGEIESALTDFEGIVQNVVSVHQEGSIKRLVAYYIPAEGAEFNTTDLRGFLKDRLPDFMIPSFFVEIDKIPLTANNKIDYKSLPEPEKDSLTLETEYVEASTPTQHTLVGIWKEVLGLEKVGVNDNFFELGGDSIMSIQVVARSNKAGMPLTPKDIFSHQTVAELAEKVESGEGSVEAEQGIVTGEFPLTPIHHWFFEKHTGAPNHYNHWVLRSIPGEHDIEAMAKAFQAVLEHHDALRMRFTREGDSWRGELAPPEEEIPFREYDLCAFDSDEEIAEEIDRHLDLMHQAIDVTSGPIAQMAWFKLGGGRPGKLGFVIHHIAVDTVSWPFIIEDFFSAYQRIRNDQRVVLQAKTTSFIQWAESLQEYADSEELREESAYWLDDSRGDAGALPRDHEGGDTSHASTDSLHVELETETTQILVRSAPKLWKVQVNDVLLTALAVALCRWRGQPEVLINMEGHGREEIGAELNVSRTVSWFTSFYPLLVKVDESLDPEALVRAVKEQAQAVPNRGIGYSVLRYMTSDETVSERLHAMPEAEIAFNYTGIQTGQGGDDSGEGQIHLSEGQASDRRHPIEIVSHISGGRLMMKWNFSTTMNDKATLKRVTDDFLNTLRAAAKALI
jgi:amino acid adenylation domain-containing protein/non-ribosomal peptide synthase protein (TIGR01720 family)